MAVRAVRLCGSARSSRSSLFQGQSISRYRLELDNIPSSVTVKRWIRHFISGMRRTLIGLSSISELHDID